MAGEVYVSAPHTETELLDRVNALRGHTLSEIAARHALLVPASLQRAKGWMGLLLERALGADAGSRPVPDFQRLHIELKTVPLDHHRSVMESTYVCAANLTTIGREQWSSSSVRMKLARVLWVPIEADRQVPLRQRRVGQAFLWNMDEESEGVLSKDWQEITDRIALGQLNLIPASLGVSLQLRPKAANAAVLCDAYGEDGSLIRTLPRGFYLRSRFTQKILQKHFELLCVDPI